MASTLLNAASRPSAVTFDGLAFVCRACRRTKATFGQHRKALRVKPDPLFEPSRTATSDHIIFNPPSSAPSVYHTPAKFLPKSDPRWKALRQASTSAASSSPPIGAAAVSGSVTSQAKELPPIRTPYQKKYHLDEQQIEEMRRLRKEDPTQWTRVALAEKFNCSQFFVNMCCGGTPGALEQHNRRLAEIKSRWGRTKTEAREDRKTRKALWGRDA